MWSWPRQISFSTRKTHCIFSPVKWYKSCIGSINNYITWFEYKHTLYWTYNVSAGWYCFMENCCRLKIRVLSSINVHIIHCSRWCQIRWECKEAKRESWWLCTSSRSTWWSSSRAGTCLILTHTIIKPARAGPKGLRAESARAFTGRRNSHSGRGEDFLTGQPDFFTETAVTESRKIVSKVGN